METIYRVTFYSIREPWLRVSGTVDTPETIKPNAIMYSVLRNIGQAILENVPATIKQWRRDEKLEILLLASA